MTSDRGAQIAAFYAANERRLRNAVTRDTGASREAAADACQTAWLVLLRRDDVALDAHGYAWLCKVARTTGLRQATSRENPAGAFLPVDEREPGELVEPVGDCDPCDLVLARERYAEHVVLLARLTSRERRFLGLHAIGLNYQEIADVGNASLRTVERQILRARGKLGLTRHGSQTAPKPTGARS